MMSRNSTRTEITENSNGTLRLVIEDAATKFMDGHNDPPRNGRRIMLVVHPKTIENEIGKQALYMRSVDIAELSHWTPQLPLDTQLPPEPRTPTTDTTTRAE